MPDNWVPPVPAWSADLGDSSALAIAYYGVQHHTSDTRDSETAFALLRHRPDAPEHIERGRFNDLAGLVNEVFVCYWRVSGTYVRFAEQSALARWLADDARLSSARRRVGGSLSHPDDPVRNLILLRMPGWRGEAD